MSIMLIHKGPQTPFMSDNGLLKDVFHTRPLSDLIFERIRSQVFVHKTSDTILIPEGWACDTGQSRFRVIPYKPADSVAIPCSKNLKKESWFVIHNGRFITHLNYMRLFTKLNAMQGDIAAVQVTPQLKAFHEKTLIDPHNHLVGFRRFYGDSVRPIAVSDDWPHCLFIRTDCLDRAIVDGVLPLCFRRFVAQCNSQSLKIRGLEVGGGISDLNTEAGLIGLLETMSVSGCENDGSLSGDSAVHKADSAKIFGRIRCGKNVRIDAQAIVAGPAMLGDDVMINQESVVRASIIGSGVSIPAGCVVQNRVLLNSADCLRLTDAPENQAAAAFSRFDEDADSFRVWRRFSYAGFFKRIVDIIFASCVLILFTPIILIVSLVIKLTSPGPIFFAHKRQGLRGKVFDCLKFRTMIVGADEMQDKIRKLNQVDGPQFRIDDDPRISSVGKFLRDTYLDEIPQFLNVLMGQMSVVGPRPSPESENTLCPSWHDARLSVRPGVTGLWQIRRTRLPMQDFQEWIHYDIQYVKDLSWKMDLWICWLTVKKMFESFIHQF